MTYYNTEKKDCQSFSENFTNALDDRSSSGRVRPWREKKEASEKLADIYQYVDMDKSERVRSCGDFLEFNLLSDGSQKLTSANFCRVRLCPMCQWRRSLKVYSQMTRIFSALDAEKYAVLCLTLTVKNCSGSDLSQTLDLLADAWFKLSHYKLFTRAVKGFYRATEVTHNFKDNTYHPHFHVLLIVDKRYFKDACYIPHAEWIALWRRALSVDYDPSLKVYKLYLKDGQDITKALCEVTKYTVKESDFISDDMNLNVETVALLDKAFNKRKFVTLGGILRELHKKLNLSDIEDDGDLVHVDDESQMTDESKAMITYVWHTGYKQYYAVSAAGHVKGSQK